jgi:hypothetical protein
MAGREELVGTDVVVVHRLLKNRVGDELGMPAYALYTDALVRAMGLDDPAAAGMRAYRETFESVGEVAGGVTDLGAAWEAEPDVSAGTARHLSAPMAAAGGPIAYLPEDGSAG